jgi:NADH:ubiquinone oxidoreductase subunit E
MNAQRVTEIIDSYDADRTASLAILQDIQREYNFLPREALELVAQRLEVPVGHVYQMATFFKAFSLKPRGEYLIKVCLGTACHVQGGPHILGELEHHLQIRAGQTTADGKFSVEGVRCLGACALAPIVVVNEEVYGKMSTAAAGKLVADLNQGAAKGNGKSKALSEGGNGGDGNA